MKKGVMLFCTIGLSLILICGCGKTQNVGDKSDKKEVKWRSSYTALLKSINKNNSNQTNEFVLRDLDSDDIPELIVKEELKLIVYRQNKDVEEIGNYNFSTGTTRFFTSKNKKYPGIFFFYVSGGLNHYGYLDIKDGKLHIQELWNEDYSGISKEIGETRDVIEEFSEDKGLIEESKNLYNSNADLVFDKVSKDNINLQEFITD